MYGIIGAIVQISANTQNINKTKKPIVFLFSYYDLAVVDATVLSVYKSVGHIN